MAKAAPFQPAARRIVRQAPPASGDRKISELVEKTVPLDDDDMLTIVDGVTGENLRISIATLRSELTPP